MIANDSLFTSFGKLVKRGVGGNYVSHVRWFSILIGAVV